MFRLINKLQQKSEPTRRRIVWGTTASIMVIVVAVWITTLSARTPPQEKEVSPAVTPFQSFEDSFSQLLNNISSQEQSGDDATTSTSTIETASTTFPAPPPATEESTTTSPEE